MNAEVLITRPSLPHEDVRRDIFHLSEDAEFAQAIHAVALIQD